MNSTVAAGIYQPPASRVSEAEGLHVCSIGEALIDTIDDLINDGRIEPQLAMKILSNFDKAISEVLNEKVKARLNFKVSMVHGSCKSLMLKSFPL